MVISSRIFKALTIAVFVSFILVSCRDFSPPAENTTSQSPAVSEANINKLAQLVADLKSSVGIRDYAQASTILSQVRETWTQIEAEIKAQQPAKHEAIEIHISNLEKDLKVNQPSTATIMSDLKLLETVIYNLSE